MHAALGLCNLKYVDKILFKRKEQWWYYKELLENTTIQVLELDAKVSYNFAYFPAVFPSEKDLLTAIRDLNSENIFPRRYFYPSLNTLPYTSGSHCQVSENISKRVCCLPLYYDLQSGEQAMIVNIINRGLKSS
jgi:dTDP-4-amino-4,6-dideoxygalactose transaminase